MAARGHGPYGRRIIQDPGMMREGPFPGGHGPAGPRRVLEPLPSPDHLENKLASQAAEIERLLRENQRLGETHVAMREEVGANQQEIQKLRSHIASIRTETDIQIRGLVEKIRKMEDDIRTGEMVKMELQQAHKEAKGLVAARQDLTGEIQVLTEELQKTGHDGKRLPELLVELDGLQQEHQKLRATFEHEKGLNMEQVDQMRAMEKNLISMAREVERLRFDVMRAEKGELGNPYAGPYGSHAHGHGGGYPNVGFAHGSPAGYPPAYGQQQPQMAGGAPKGSVAGYSDSYARHPGQTASGAGYSDGFGRSQVPVSGDGMAAGEAVNRYGGRRGVSPVNAVRRGSIP